MVCLGSPSITGKLYTINPNTGARTVVDSTIADTVTSATVVNNPYGMTTEIELPLKNPYTVAAGTYITASISMTAISQLIQ